jgi:WhiB family redox-sensing transcriptional regulator
VTDDNVDWEQAACGISHQDDSFFPEKENGAQVTAREAKRVCNGDEDAGMPVCPIRDECLAYAISVKERYGIWGGTSERERARIMRHERQASSAHARWRAERLTQRVHTENAGLQQQATTTRSRSHATQSTAGGGRRAAA